MANTPIEQSRINSNLKTRLEALRGTGRTLPKYEVIKEFLLDELEKGHFKPGQALPSENTLIERLGVARNTVRQAIDELVKAGLVRRVHGKGNFFTRSIRNDTEEQLAVFSLLLPEISHGLYPVLVKGFDHHAGSIQRQVLLCNTDFNITKQGNIILQMLEKNVSGVALVPALTPLTPAYHVSQLQRHNIPVVFCHRAVAGVSAPLITWDAEEVARLAGETLLKHGHRQIAYFARTRYAMTEIHENGLRRTLRDVGLELPEHRIYYGDSPREEDGGQFRQHMEALKPLLNGSNRVTAIFCNDDNEAELVHYALTELGIRVPDDVSLMGFGDCHSRSGVFQSRLSSVTIDEYDLGGRAAKVLNEMRTGQRSIESEEVIYKPLSLFKGQTIAPQ